MFRKLLGNSTRRSARYRRSLGKIFPVLDGLEPRTLLSYGIVTSSYPTLTYITGGSLTLVPSLTPPPVINTQTNTNHYTDILSDVPIQAGINATTNNNDFNSSAIININQNNLFNVTMPSTTTTLAPITPVHEKEAITLTATVTSSDIFIAPTGTVTFKASRILGLESIILGSANIINGSASLTAFNNLDLSSPYTVTAYYSGDAKTPGSTSTGKLLERKDKSYLALELLGNATEKSHLWLNAYVVDSKGRNCGGATPSFPDLPTQYQSVSTSLMIKVPTPLPATGNPGAGSGSVSIYNANQIYTRPNPTGTFTFYVDSIPVGNADLDVNNVLVRFRLPQTLSYGWHELSLGYSGDRLNDPATSTVYRVFVSHGTTTSSLATSAATIYEGQAFTLTTTTSTTECQYLSPYGNSVTFRMGDTVLANIPTSSENTFMTLQLSPGTYTFKSTFNGDDYFYGSETDPVTVTVLPATNKPVARTPDAVPVIGEIDTATTGYIAGWAYDADTPNDPILIRVDIDGITCAMHIANAARDDLSELPSPNHGFRFSPYDLNYEGTHKIELFAINPTTGQAVLLDTANVIVGDHSPSIAVAPDTGAQPTIKVFSAASGAERFSFLAYDRRYRGAVRVASADFNGDGTTDIVTSTGSGGVPLVNVFNGKTGELMSNFWAYDYRYLGGVQICTADVTGDGKMDIITATDVGGLPLVNVYDQYGALLMNFWAYDQRYLGGVRISAGDFDGDGKAEITTSTAQGGVPLVNVFNCAGVLIGNFWGENPETFRSGLRVVAGDFNGDGIAEIAIAKDTGTPEIKLFDLRTRSSFRTISGADNTWTSGLRIGAVDVNSDGVADLVCTPAKGHAPKVMVFNGLTGSELNSFWAYDQSVTTGLFVTAG